MKILGLSVLFLLFSSNSFALARAEITACNINSKKNDICYSDIAALRPTQMAVGMLEVREKEADLRPILHDSEKLAKYVLKHQIPAVIGSNGDLYMVDHHHLGKALLDLGVRQVYCKVMENFSNLRGDDFWGEMEKNSWVYPYDHNGNGPLPVSRLPYTVAGLEDDPYRSLAGAVRNAGGFLKVATPFSEFKWANYFRTRITLDAGPEGFEKAVQEGVKLACSAEAKDLPGYKGPCPQ